MNENFLTNGWVQLGIAAGSLVGLLAFMIMWRGGDLRWPGLGSE